MFCDIKTILDWVMNINSFVFDVKVLLCSIQLQQ